MLDNAKNKACELIVYPQEEKYINESIRNFQGCPTIAVTKKGRIFLGWYSGGRREPHMDNFNLVVYSDDGGKTWTKPVLVIPSSLKNCIQALDIQMWINPDGELCIYWVQNNTVPHPGVTEHIEIKNGKPWVTVDGYDFFDFDHAMWKTVCHNPDADVLEFSKPEYMDKGFLRCKPTVLKDGRQLYFNYDQNSDRYGYSISTDGGKTHNHYYGAKQLLTCFDEAMAYEMLDGRIRMLARTEHGTGYLAESYSFDGGLTWSDAVLSDIASPNTRFFVARMPSGNILLINNDHRMDRKNMTVYLSEDDGVTWKYKRLIDDRNNLSYPDVDFFDGKIYLTYDRERTGAKEILFLCFTEDDIMNDSYVFEPAIVSKPSV